MHTYSFVSAMAMLMLFYKAQCPATIKPGQELIRCVRAVKAFLAHCGFRDIFILNATLLICRESVCMIKLIFSHYDVHTIEKSGEFLCRGWNVNRFEEVLSAENFNV